MNCSLVEQGDDNSDVEAPDYKAKRMCFSGWKDGLLVSENAY
jgi:hypothetical protein